MIFMLLVGNASLTNTLLNALTTPSGFVYSIAHRLYSCSRVKGKSEVLFAFRFIL
jgi:hypothetical protein